MKIIAVVAQSQNGAIGRSNAGLPWPSMKADMRRFRSLTQDHAIIMGRKTWDSLAWKPLARRINIVLTRDTGFRHEGCLVAASWEEAVRHCAGQDEAFVIGGAETYRQAMPFTTRVEMTVIHRYYFGDVMSPFMGLANDPTWRLESRVGHHEDADNPAPYTFLTWERAGEVRMVAP